MEEDLRKLTLCFHHDNAEIERMSGKLKEKTLMVEGGEKKLKQCNMENQEKLVEKSLVRMKIDQIERRIAKQNDTLYTLEKHRMDLESAINERLIDIRSQQDMLTLRKKYLADERAQLKADISERTLKIDQLKNKFELSQDLLGKNEDGSIVTATQIKIQTAQEKYLLLKDGNDLSDKIVKAEDDVKALENTLKLMNFSNENYKRAFQKVEEENPYLQQLSDLQDDYCKALSSLKLVRMKLAEDTDNLNTMNQERQECEEEFECAEKVRLDNNDILLKLHKDLLDQKTKIQRAERELKNSIKAAKHKLQDDEIMKIFEKDLKFKELEERNNVGFQHFGDLVDNIPEMEAMVTKYFCDRNLRLPVTSKRTRSQMSWRSENTVSDFSMRMDSSSSKQSKEVFCILFSFFD